MEKVPASLKALAIKCRSKKELCTVLMNDRSVFISPIQDANAAYVREVVSDLPRFSLYIYFKLSWSVCRN